MAFRFSCLHQFIIDLLSNFTLHTQPCTCYALGVREHKNEWHGHSDSKEKELCHDKIIERFRVQHELCR